MPPPPFNEGWRPCEEIIGTVKRPEVTTGGAGRALPGCGSPAWDRRARGVRGPCPGGRLPGPPPAELSKVRRRRRPLSPGRRHAPPSAGATGPLSQMAGSRTGPPHLSRGSRGRKARPHRGRGGREGGGQIAGRLTGANGGRRAGVAALRPAVWGWAADRGGEARRRRRSGTCSSSAAFAGSSA